MAEAVHTVTGHLVESVKGSANVERGAVAVGGQCRYRAVGGSRVLRCSAVGGQRRCRAVGSANVEQGGRGACMQRAVCRDPALQKQCIR